MYAEKRRNAESDSKSTMVGCCALRLAGRSARRECAGGFFRVGHFTDAGDAGNTFDGGIEEYERGCGAQDLAQIERQSIARLHAKDIEHSREKRLEEFPGFFPDFKEARTAGYRS